MLPARSALLTHKSLAQAAASLAKRDKHLAGILATFGHPPLWRRPTGFPPLVRIILEQQVSLGSAAAMFARLTNSIDPFAPEQFSRLGEYHLRSLGVTRQKAAYLIHLSSALAEGTLNLARLTRMSDADAKLEERVQAFSRQIRCLVCQNETLADSTAELAVDLRREIREQMKAGRSDEEITAFLTKRYGDFVLYRPPVKPSTYLLWFGPFVFLGLGLFALICRLKHGPTRSNVRAISPGERKRARQLLAERHREGTV